MPFVRTRTGLLVVSVLCLAITEFTLQTWWLPSKWRPYDAAATGPMLVSADGRTITLTVNWQCEQEPELVAREGADRVGVLLHRKGFKGPTYQCPENAVGGALVSTRLRAPLASRPLVDAVTGQPVAYFDGRELAQPTYLPPGYDRPAGGSSPDPGSTPASTNGPTWSTRYRSHQGASAGASLVITQTRGTAAPPQGQQQAVVDGHAATFSESLLPGGRSIVWSDEAYRFTVSSLPASLSDEELLRVAEGLHHP